MMNKVTMLGRLVKDLELRYTQNGTATLSGTIAVDRGMSKDKKAEAQSKGYPTSDFPRIVAWSKTAENMAKFFKKGDMVLIEGSLQTGSYDKDGVKHYTTDVNVTNFYFVGGNKSEDKPSYDTSDFASMEDDDLPPF